MKLALHRSVSFWSGLLMMGFVCWAWRDSFLYHSWFQRERIMVMTREGYADVVYMAGGAGISCERNRIVKSPFIFERFPPPFVVSGSSRSYYVQETGPETIKQFWNRGFPQQVKGSWGLFLPYWLILLAFAIPWSALLLWRARRRRRAAAVA